MMDENSFIDAVCSTAQSLGYTLEIARNGRRQIDFGHKKLHEGHLRQLFPTILSENVHIPTLINEIAPGRPCTHKPMRIILDDMSS